MTNRKTSNIIVCGSIAYDRIMDFPGKFSDHILPEKVHMLNVSFAANGLKESFGGTAGNIAYNLSLLGERPKVLAVVGKDFAKYREWLKKQNIDISKVKILESELTASAYIITDKADNQITGYWQGPKDKIPLAPHPCLRRQANPLLSKERGKSHRKCGASKGEVIAIIAPDCKDRMLEYVKIFKQKEVPYIFDPGQQITSFRGDELKKAIRGAKVLIGNDYEIQLILNKLRLGMKKLEKMVEILVVTKGARGSEIYHKRRIIKIPAAKPANTSDPTGAGDAYRAGLIKGLIEGWPLPKVGRLAGLVAVYTVEKYGTQTHRFTWQELEKRYRENYGENL